MDLVPFCLQFSNSSREKKIEEKRRTRIVAEIE
jgi:hypothetical protein